MILGSPLLTFLKQHVGWVLDGVVLGAFITGATLYRKWAHILARWTIEHEMLIDDYCNRKKIDREDLPTRHHR